MLASARAGHAVRSDADFASFASYDVDICRAREYDVEALCRDILIRS